MKRVLWFGFYKPDYARNKVLISGLRANGVEVVECNVDVRKCDKWGKYRKLWHQARALSGERWDAVIVAFPGLNAVWLARLLFRAPIIHDAFMSFYQMEIEDREACKRQSLRALTLYLSEWLAIRLATLTLLDTRQHIDYFVRTFKADPDKFIRVPVGSDDAVYRPGTVAGNDGIFTVEFHGTYIPLQGVDVILRAAKELERDVDIKFRLIGRGQTYQKMKQLAESLSLSNVTFLDPIPPVSVNGPSLVRELQAADVVLGIFGTGRKTQMVVPNKVYEGLACGRPVITADTPAIREFFVPGKDLMVVSAGDAPALADAIRRVKKDPAERSALAAHGLSAYRSAFTPRKIAAGLISGLDTRFNAVPPPTAKDNIPSMR